MTKYIINKMLDEWKETIANIILISCLMTVIMVCCNIAVRIMNMVKDDWYKNSIEVNSISDPFIREKMGIILWAIMVLLGILCVFCLVLYALKLRLDIVKESGRISVFQVLGYGYCRRCAEIYLCKMIEIVMAIVMAVIMAYGVWRYLCSQELFGDLIFLIDKNKSFEWSFAGITYIVMAIWCIVNILYIVKRKTKIMDMKGDER